MSWAAHASLVALISAGCDGDHPTAIPPPPDTAKATPTTTWLARPRLFASGLRLAALAATPSRLLATTLGPGLDKIVVLDESGQAAPFEVAFDAPPDAACQIAVSPGLLADFPLGDVFVSLGPQVWRLQPDRLQRQLFGTLPAGQGDVAGLCFDAVGSFGFALIALTSTGSIYRLLPDGAWAWVAAVEPGSRGPSLASARFGRYAGQLLVAFPPRAEVQAVSAEGVVAHVASWPGVSAAAAIPDAPRGYARTGAALFVAVDSGEIYRFGLDEVGLHTGDVVLSSLQAVGSGLATPVGRTYELRAWSRPLGPEVAAACVQRPAYTRIALDVRPGTSLDALTAGSDEPLPVALLSSPYFAPRLVDAASVVFAGVSPLPLGKATQGRFAELNGDGEADLVLYFRPADMQLGAGVARLALAGSTFTGDRIQGEAHVQVQAP